MIFESFSLGVGDAFFVCWWFSLHGWLWLWYQELMHIFYRIMFIRCLKCIITIHNIHEIFFYVNVDAFIVLIFQFIVGHNHDLHLLFVLLMHLLCLFFSWSITIMMFISFFYGVNWCTSCVDSDDWKLFSIAASAFGSYKFNFLPVPFPMYI